MAKSKAITVRVQCAEGTKRIEIEPSSSTSRLFEKVREAFEFPGFTFALYQDRNLKNEVMSTRSKTVQSCNIKHGDMLYLKPLNGTVLPSQDQQNSSSGSSLTSSGDPGKITPTTPVTKSIAEDEVDRFLLKVDGKIQQKRDEKLCRHGPKGCCVHCSPLEPYDEAYLKEQNIKHLSFHSYIRKLTAGVDRGKFVALEDMSCRIKPGCKDHPPWPRGICSKCQPNAITLNRQTYRHVDNVMFENPFLVERFLNYWRTTGHQRIGFLYGRYEYNPDVPLGIRATVAAIYEPPQEGTRDSVTLLPDEKEELVDNIAGQLNLTRVGWIFTDLLADDVKKGTVKCVRGIESHFLSAQECIMAGHFQNRHQNPCHFSPSGYFGSKFVTVCVTGDSNNQVHMEGYQVSNQCMALVRDSCLLPTRDAPELGYVLESSDKQYVPDVYYKEKDQYGNEVQRLARPLPVEYLLVDVPASTPLAPVFTFSTDPAIQPFPVENRMIEGHLQDFNALCSYMRQFQPQQALSAFSDFHLLTYIAAMDMLPMKEYIGPLLEAVRNKNEDQACDWSRSEHWATLEQLMSASSGSPPPSSPRGSVPLEDGGAAGGGSVQQSPMWTCSHCTFLNQPGLASCEMCSLPR